MLVAFMFQTGNKNVKSGSLKVIRSLQGQVRWRGENMVYLRMIEHQISPLTVIMRRCANNS